MSFYSNFENLKQYSMSAKILVIKQSGEKQIFSKEKLTESLLRSGAPEPIAREVVSEIESMLYDEISTRKIYKKAFKILESKIRSLAARYSLKNALLELGPSGYPFEKFIGEIFKKEGYQVKTGQIIQGRCISHEVDVVAEKDHLTIMAECKYGNDQGKINSVQVPLYVNSRFQDIRQIWEMKPENKGKEFQGWIVTNTRFSSDAEVYGTCAGLRLVSWSFPERGNLRELVEKHALFPVTALTSISKKQKQKLIASNIILVEHLVRHAELINEFGLTTKERQEILSEAESLCAVSRIL
jgi:hypothetical protein